MTTFPKWLGLIVTMGLISGVLTMVGCIAPDESDTNRSTESGGEVPPTAPPHIEPKVDGRSPTPTPLGISGPECPADTTICELATTLESDMTARGAAAVVERAQPVTVVCPDPSTPILALKEACQGAAAGETRTAYSLGGKLNQLLPLDRYADALRSTFTDEHMTIAGVACRKVKESLNCQDWFAVTFRAKADNAPQSGTIIVYSIAADGIVSVQQPGAARAAIYGGWLDTSVTGASAVPEQMWVIPWDPGTQT